MRIVSSAPSLLRALNKTNSGWRCIAFGRNKSKGGLMATQQKHIGKQKIVSTNKRLSASFYYKGF